MYTEPLSSDIYSDLYRLFSLTRGFNGLTRAIIHNEINQVRQANVFNLRQIRAWAVNSRIGPYIRANNQNISVDDREHFADVFTRWKREDPHIPGLDEVLIDLSGVFDTSSWIYQ